VKVEMNKGKKVEESAVGKVIQVNLQACGKAAKAILDPGAQISLVNTSFLMDLVSENLLNLTDVRTAFASAGQEVLDVNGRKVDCLGIVSLPVIRDGSMRPSYVRLHITEAPFGFDLLLGTNCLNTLGFKLYDTLNEKWVDFEQAECGKSSPVVIFNAKIAPNDECVVQNPNLIVTTMVSDKTKRISIAEPVKNSRTVVEKLGNSLSMPLAGTGKEETAFVRKCRKRKRGKRIRKNKRMTSEAEPEKAKVDPVQFALWRNFRLPIVLSFFLLIALASLGKEGEEQIDVRKFRVEFFSGRWDVDAAERKIKVERMRDMPTLYKIPLFRTPPSYLHYRDEEHLEVERRSQSLIKDTGSGQLTDREGWVTDGGIRQTLIWTYSQVDDKQRDSQAKRATGGLGDPRVLTRQLCSVASVRAVILLVVLLVIGSRVCSFSC
jgi:hypothetical protein